MQTIFDEIQGHHRRRNFMMEQRKRMNQALSSFIRVQLGWKKELPDAERKAIADRADYLIEIAEDIDKAERDRQVKFDRAVKKHDALVAKLTGAQAKGKRLDETAPAFLFDLKVERVEGDDDPQFLEWQSIIASVMAGRASFDVVEDAATAEMERLAVQLPVWQTWGEGVRAFGERSLAVIVGEAGDLSKYDTHSRLWKRMGLAVMDGVRQGGLSKTAAKDDWIAHGYNKKRRSQMYVIGDCLVKQGEFYRKVYLDRKEYERVKAEAAGLTVAPSAKIPKGNEAQYISDGHIHKRSQRYMEKKLLRDLWNEWRKAGDRVSEKTIHVSPSATPMKIAA